MLQSKRAVTNFQISEEEFITVCNMLETRMWIPAIYHLHKRFAELAGVDPQEFIKKHARVMQYGRRRFLRENYGDIFFHDNDVYYVVNIGQERMLRRVGGETFMEVHNREGMEFGVITSDNDEDASVKLDRFYSAFKNAVGYVVDGRRTRHWDFSLYEDVGVEDLLANLKESDDETSVKFSKAEINDQEIAAAQALLDNNNRMIMRTISQAGFVREQEILSGSRKKHDISQEVLNRLQELNLISSEVIVQCRKSGTPLARVSRKDILSHEDFSHTTCPNCGASFHEEATMVGYGVSSLGKKLLESSHWMTVIVTKTLIDIGITRDNIAWNVSDHSEEIDLVVNCSDDRWIFELKDREFGPGDAHPLNYRQVRYQARKAIIVTTEKVSKDAKRVLEELRREADRGRRDSVVLIEGMAELQPKLEAEAAGATLRQSTRRLTGLAEGTGYDIPAIISEKFNQDMTVEADREL